MKDYIESLFMTRLYGIPVGAWQQFFRLFTEGYDFDEIEERIASLDIAAAPAGPEGTLERVATILLDLAAKLRCSQ